MTEGKNRTALFQEGESSACPVSYKGAAKDAAARLKMLKGGSDHALSSAGT
jgi:hypothetical protein